MGFILLPFIARVLGPLEIGRIGLAQTFGLFSLIIIEFGFSIYAVREVSRLKKNRKALHLFIATVFNSQLSLIPFIALLGILIYHIVGVFDEIPVHFFLALLGSIFQGLAPTWYFEGQEKIKIVAVLKTLSRFLAFLSIVFLVRAPIDSWIVLAAYSFSSLIQFLFLFIKMKKEIGQFQKVKRRSILKIFSKCKSSFVISVLPIFYQNICLIILGYLVNPVIVGYYFASLKIYLGFNNLYSPIGQAFFPIISKVEYFNSNSSKNEIKYFLKITITMGLVFFLINFYFAEQIVILLLGDEYFPSIKLLKFFSFVLPLTAISHVLGRQWLMAKMKDSEYAKIQALSTFLGVITIFLLIGHYELLALPFSFVVFEMSSIILICFFLRKSW